MKKILIKIRTSIKFIILVFIASVLILGVISLVYKPIYSVYLDGELIGYSSNKRELQEKINYYVENGDEENNNLAFIFIDEMPKYKMCLLKRNIKTNDSEIMEKIKATGIPYYRFYTILDDDEEKVYVPDFKTAEDVVNELKKKDSNNIDEVVIQEKYETELKSFVTKEEAVSKLYEKKIVVAKKPTENKNSSTKYPTSSGSVVTSRNISKGKISLGISLIRPITGTISSRFGSVSGIRSGAHTGLDIAAPNGTSIKAAASGTVTFSGWKGSYGKLIVISHGNGIQTYYAHCSALYASVGDKVSQGEKIAAVGSTGNSTGNHLHLEIRVNGVAYNPQNYLY